MAKEPKGAAPAAPAAPATVAVLLPVEVDLVRYNPGDTAEIRAELVDALVAAGAVALPEAPDA